MSEQAITPLLIAVSTAAPVFMLSLHYHIKNRLGKQHDAGYLWLAAGMGVWVLMHFVEYLFDRPFMESLTDAEMTNYQEVPRRVLSFFNNLFFLLSLTYFKDIPNWLARLSAISWRSMVVFLLSSYVLLMLGAMLFSGHDWQWALLFADFCCSMICISLLFVGIASVFFARELPEIALLAILIWGMFVLIQLASFNTELAPANQWQLLSGNWHDATLGESIRLLSRIGLLCCLLIMATTWVGRQLELQLVNRSPAERRPHFLRFESRGQNCYLVFQYGRRWQMPESQMLNMSTIFATFNAFKIAAEQQLTTPDQTFATNAFTNFTTNRRSFLAYLNQALAQAGYTETIQDKDLFQKVADGHWRFCFEQTELEVVEG